MSSQVTDPVTRREAHPWQATVVDVALVAGASVVVLGGLAFWSVRPPTLSWTATAMALLLVAVLIGVGVRLAHVPLRNELSALAAAVLAVADLEQADASVVLLPVWAIGVMVVYPLVLRSGRWAVPRASIAVLAGAVAVVVGDAVDLPAEPFDQLLIGLATYTVVVQLLIMVWDGAHGIRSSRSPWDVRSLALLVVGAAYVAGLVLTLELVASKAPWSDPFAMGLICLLGLTLALVAWHHLVVARTGRALLAATARSAWPADHAEEILGDLLSEHLHLGNVSIEDEPAPPPALSEELRPGRHLVVRRSPGDITFTEADRDLVAGTAAFARAAYLHDARERELRQEATSDELTGLYTFAHWRAMLDIKFDRREPGERIGVLFLDLDYFKQFNEEYGHFAGDAVLAAVGRRLFGFSRRARWGRFGGDEFVGFVRDVADADELAALATEVARLVAEPIAFEGRELVATCTVGRALSGDPHDAAIDVIGAADDDLLRRKHARAVAETPGDAEIVRALAAGGIDVAYQPLVDLRTDEVLGWEALLRGSVGEFGPMDATELIAAATRMGALDLVSGTVAEQGLALVEEACERSGRPLRLALNVEPQQLVADSAFLAWLMERAGASPVRITVEVTERGGEPWHASYTEVTRELARHGIRVVLDDFGAGYSRFGTLASGTWDGVSLSRAAVVPGARGRRLLHDLVHLLHGLGLEVGIEGLETEYEVAVAAGAGAELGQGMRLGAPIGAAAVRAGWADGLVSHRTDDEWHARRGA